MNSYFSLLWKLGSLKIKVRADLQSGEDVLPGLHMATLLLCPHVAESREREEGVLGFSLLIRTLIHHPGSTFTISGTPNCLLKSSPTNTISIWVCGGRVGGLGFQHRNL